MPDSSPDTEIEVTPAVVEQTSAPVDASEVSAESSPAEQKGQQKGDILSAVKAAMAPKKESSPGSANPGSEEATAETAAKDGSEAEDDSEDFSEEEKARLSQKAKRRFHKLAGEVTEFRNKVADLEPQAQQFQSMARFVGDAGLSVDEVNRGFDVMRNLKQDPLRAFEQIKPIYEQLAQIVGEVLPADLHQAVNLGQITEAHARELARNRSVAALSQDRVQRVEQQRHRERQQTDVQGRWNSAASATTEWESSKAKSDPDWKLKQGRVIELIELDLLKRQKADPNFIPSTEDAVGMANAALAKVNEEMKQFRPKPKAVNTITDVASSRSTPAPKTMLEAAKQGLARARAG